MQDKSDALKEIDAMKNVAEALSNLGEDSIRRVLAWAGEYFGVEVRSADGRKIGTKASSGVGESLGDEEQGLSYKTRFETLADLYSAANPGTDAEKVLVAAYWLQEKIGQDSIDSFTVNKELKNLGYGVRNMTRAFEYLKRANPQLAVQLRKSGTSKQARKKYKITNAGKEKVLAMIHGEKEDHS